MNLAGLSTFLVLAGSVASPYGSGRKGAVDPKAMAIMRKNAETMFGLRSFEAVCVMKATIHSAAK